MYPTVGTQVCHTSTYNWWQLIWRWILWKRIWRSILSETDLTLNKLQILSDVRYQKILSQYRRRFEFSRVSISDCTVGEGNSAHFFPWFNFYPNDPVTQTENTLSQFHRSDRVPSTRQISPSLSKSDRLFAYSHRVKRVHRVTGFLTEFAIKWLFFSPSAWSETHRVTEFTEFTESNEVLDRVISHRVHRVYRVQRSPWPSDFSRVTVPRGLM